MTFVPVMWSVWGAFVALFAAISIYISTLSRDEEDQIFLDDSFNHIKSQQDAIAARVAKVQPARKIALGLLIAMTIFVLGYYIFDIVRQFN